MKRMLCLLAVFLPFGVCAFGQANLDPGLRDSVILQGLPMYGWQPYSNVRIFVVTDDSVSFYNFPLTWGGSGIFRSAAISYYYPPLNTWDDKFDSMCVDDNFLRMVGWCDLEYDSLPDYTLNTSNLRLQIMTLRFENDPSFWGPVVIDSTFDPINGSLSLGLIDGLTEFKPAFVPGYLQIPQGVNDNPAPTEFNLSQNYPNPFNASTMIDFSLAKNEDVTLVIYDLLGRRVRILQTGWLAEGSYSVIWDGNDESGAVVSSGLYLYQLRTPEKSEIKRLTLVR